MIVFVLLFVSNINAPPPTLISTIQISNHSCRANVKNAFEAFLNRQAKAANGSCRADPSFWFLLSERCDILPVGCAVGCGFGDYSPGDAQWCNRRLPRLPTPSFPFPSHPHTLTPSHLLRVLQLTLLFKRGRVLMATTGHTGRQ